MNLRASYSAEKRRRNSFISWFSYLLSIIRRWNVIIFIYSNVEKNQRTAFTSPRISRAGKYNVLFFIDCRAIKELANNHITKWKVKSKYNSKPCFKQEVCLSLDWRLSISLNTSIKISMRVFHTQMFVKLQIPMGCF